MKTSPIFSQVTQLSRVAALLFAGLAHSHAEKLPNIVFILADDLGHADVGFNGSKWYETPALDALAKDGLVLEQAYMYPSCSPSRTAMFTGKQSFRTGVYTVPVLETGSAEENVFSRWTVETKHPIYAQPLAEKGYRSIHLGKWHIVGPHPLKELAMDYPLKEKLSQPDPGDFSWVAEHRTDAVRPYYPEGRGFLKNVGGTYRGDPALVEGGYHSESRGYLPPFTNPFIEQKPDDEWLTDRLTDDAIAFMDEHQEGPFFVNLHYYAVHRPIVVRSQELLDKYLAKNGDPATGQGIGEYRKLMASYATMVDSMDQNIQRIVDYLDEKGLRENTIIVFSSDNGHNGVQSSNHRLRGAKGYIYEGGIRVPTLINWPSKVKPSRIETPVSCLDLFPTFLELANIDDYKGVLDGTSLVPLFDGETEPSLDERPLFWHIASRWKHGACSAIRKGPYKLIQFLKDGAIELYNVEQDPAESNNIAEANPELAQQLVDELTEWRKSNKAPLPGNSILEN